MLKLKTENWKHCSKIIFKCVNSAVGPIFNEKINKKWNLWVREQCTDALFMEDRSKVAATVHVPYMNSTTCWGKRREKKKKKKGKTQKLKTQQTRIQTVPKSQLCFSSHMPFINVITCKSNTLEVQESLNLKFWFFNQSGKVSPYSFTRVGLWSSKFNHTRNMESS